MAENGGNFFSTLLGPTVTDRHGALCNTSEHLQNKHVLL